MSVSGLESVLDSDGAERSLVVVDSGRESPLRDALENLFADQSVAVENVLADDDPDEDQVVLVENGEAVARTPLSTLYESILGINTDLYTTGARGLEDAALPDVLAELAGTTFRLRDYPVSDREKLLLVAISRAIERRAFLGGPGKVRSSFQKLSRIEDERGTREVYERLSETDLDVHLYGQPDWTPAPEFDVTIHGGYAPAFTDSWFVVYDPADGSEPAALVALKRGRSHWEGVWTFDPEQVRTVTAYIEREL